MPGVSLGLENRMLNLDMNQAAQSHYPRMSPNFDKSRNQLNNKFVSMDATHRLTELP
jgi:uncharacterized membrane protein